MPTDVVMPQMGESITEGTLTKWLKKVGDTVQRDEPLFEISTDKVDAEIPSPAAGTLQEIKIAEGATVQINTVVAVIGDGAGAAAPRPRRQTAEPAAGRSVTPAAIEPAGGDRHCCPQRRTLRRRRCRDRRADAADGRVDHRRHDHQVAEAGGRIGRARRAAVRNLDRQGGRGDSVARGRRADGDQVSRGIDGRDQYDRCGDRRRSRVRQGCLRRLPPAKPRRQRGSAAAPAAGRAERRLRRAAAPRRWCARSRRTTTST